MRHVTCFHEHTHTHTHTHICVNTRGAHAHVRTHTDADIQKQTSQAINVAVMRMVSEALDIVAEASSSGAAMPSCVEGFEFLVDHGSGADSCS